MNRLNFQDSFDALTAEEQEMIRKKPWYHVTHGSTPRIHILGDDSDSNWYIAIAFRGILSFDPAQQVRDYLVLFYEIDHEPNTGTSSIEVLRKLAMLNTIKYRAFLDGSLETKELAPGITMLEILYPVMRKVVFTDDFTLEDFTVSFSEFLLNSQNPNPLEHKKTAKIEFTTVLTNALGQ